MHSTTTINLANIKLSQQLSFLKEKQFNGELQIISPRGIIWRLYFCLGRLFWVDGGRADRKSWYRHLKQYFSQLDRESLATLKQNSSGCDRYLTLAAYLEKQIIDLQQVKELIQTKVEEILFDILQQETYHSLQYSSDYHCCSFNKINSMLDKPLTLINPEEALKISKLAWAKWVEKGLGFWSPHLVVTLAKSRVTIANISPELFELLDGQNTLRDLTFLTGDNLLELAISLMTYFNKGILQYLEPEEFENNPEKKYPQQIQSIDDDSTTSLTLNTTRQSPLIVAIDNELEICQSLGKIIEEAGYRFISIENSWQAIPGLVSCQPDAILLAANMPFVKGYEILEQLRRVPHLQDKPVIMITEGIIGWLRAKLVLQVQANVSKPINSAKLLPTLKKLLSKNLLDKSSRSLIKYRGITYNLPRKKYRLYFSKSCVEKFSKKYRGIPYFSSKNELITVELEENFNNNTETNFTDNNL